MTPVRFLATAAAAATLTVVAALPARAQQAEQPTIAEVATEAGDFTTLIAALDAAGLVETFADCGAGPFTVFAPTDEAFAAAFASLGVSAEDLLAGTATLTAILQYHVVDGAVRAAEVAGLDGEAVATMSGESLTVSVEGGAVRVNDANVVTTDLEACNGVVHVVDAVLLPPSLSAAPSEAGVGEELAATGAKPWRLGALGGLVLALGVFTVRLAQRRRESVG